MENDENTQKIFELFVETQIFGPAPNYPYDDYLGSSLSVEGFLEKIEENIGKKFKILKCSTLCSFDDLKDNKHFSKKEFTDLEKTLLFPVIEDDDDTIYRTYIKYVIKAAGSNGFAPKPEISTSETYFYSKGTKFSEQVQKVFALIYKGTAFKIEKMQF